MSDCSCIDISHWQGFPDFEQVRAEGVVACIMKATEGTSYVDPNRATNFVNATAAGIECCTYHWIKPGGAKEQMQFYLEVVNPLANERMVIDYEEDGCTLDDLHEAVDVLALDPRELKITVYSGHLLKEQLDGGCDDVLRETTDLWLAQYTSGDPSWSKGTYDGWTLWQYSESGELNGISDTNVDLNRFDGSDKDLVRWISPEGTTPPPKPPKPTPDDKTVMVNVTAPPAVSVVVNVNGAVIEPTQRRRRRGRVLVPRMPDIRRR